MGKSLENAPTLPDLSYLIRGLCLTIPRHFAKCTLNHDIFIADTFGRCFSTTTVISTSPSPQTIHLPSTSTVNAYSPVGRRCHCSNDTYCLHFRRFCFDTAKLDYLQLVHFVRLLHIKYNSLHHNPPAFHHLR